MGNNDTAGRDIAEGNVDPLDRLFPGLAGEINRPGEDTLAPEELKTAETPSGLPTLIVRGVHVHSPRDPARESRRLAESAGLTDGRAPVVILGFGLGYAAEAAAEIAPGRPLIIVEKYRELLRKALKTRDLSAFLSRNRIVFVAGGSGESISAALALFENADGENPAPAVIKNRALTGMDSEWYGAVESRIRTWTLRDGVNLATLKRFGKRWIRNLARNMEAIRDLPGINALAGLAAGGPEGREALPVFLAAAGPSLDRVGPLLGEIAGRCVVVAVDTSLRFLLRHGVNPDFVLVVDPQFWNYRHLDGAAAPETCLVAESAAYPPVLRHPFRGRLLCGSLFPLGKFIEDRVDPKGQLGAGGSVATTAWDFARSLGAGDIWIAGLDLAFPEFKTHFRGAFFENRSHAESERRSPAETWLVRALREGLPFRAGANTGGTVLTDRRLSLYAAWFENSFRRFPLIRNHGLSPGGLALAGLETEAPEAILGLPERRAEINRRLDAAFARIEGDFFAPGAARLRAKRYDEAVSSLLSGLDSVRAAAERGARAAESALGQAPGRAEREKTLAILDEVTRSIAASEVREVAGFLFPAPEPAGADGAAEEPAGSGADEAFRRYLRSSLGLCRALAETAGYTVSVLKSAGNPKVLPPWNR
ncbi:MAG: DUF115 domain-containing protein [Treponema sp.]|jgi:hypothetical protein|nr:DUF115 domain-containing protein [Treponema sp.]